MHPQGRTVDAKIARLAAASHGVVTLGQLFAVGVTAEQVKTRVRRGTLIRVHRGVYRVGHLAPSVEARYLAAVPAHRLTVELDGYRYHRSRHAWELDRRREREARARGDDFRRFTYGDVDEPRAMLVELRALLSALELTPPGAR